MPVLKSIKLRALIYSSLSLGHGMAMPLQIRVSETVGAWLAVPKTQRGGVESLYFLQEQPTLH